MIRSIARDLYFKFNGSRIIVNHNLIKVHRDLSKFFNVRQNNPVEPNLYSFLERFISKGDVFIDIGANVGFISLMASNKVGPDGRVIAFEPNPFVFKYTYQTLSQNCEWSNYIVLQQAVSNSAAMLPISISSNDSLLMEDTSLVYKNDRSDSVEVLCGALDDILPNTLKASLIKLDVEGAELDVLTGASKLIQRHRPIVCVEVHGLYFESPQVHVSSIFHFFEANGYLPVNLMKGKIESAEAFMNDSGVANIDFSTKGYGNLIMLPDKGRLNEVLHLINVFKG